MHQFHHSRAGKLHFFCPLCKYHQSTNTIDRVKLKHHFQLGVLTAAVAGLAWPLCGAKGLFLYFFFWMVFEFAYRLRKRQALICESCGFDPFLYKQDIHKARAALKKHWQQRIEAENLFAGKKLKNYETSGVKTERRGISGNPQAWAEVSGEFPAQNNEYTTANAPDLSS